MGKIWNLQDLGGNVRSYQQGWAFMQISDIDKATPFFDKPLSQ
jgi:hypothetical protein